MFFSLGCSTVNTQKIEKLEKELVMVSSPTINRKETISVANKLLKYVPSHPEAHSEKGIALHHLGKYKEAIDSFDQAIKYNHLVKAFYSLSPEQHRNALLRQSYYEKAQCLRALGKLEEALEYFDLAIKHGLDHRYIHHERTEVLMELGRELD